ncbi:EpsG family protein [Tetragenococcus halophilus]|uniref:EpsG family protein n=1 Tax=Tetragenococcus halophilus TaxID=51669 RepID=UPI000B92A636|nr:EpsG family protein [Tetragenococcus halophilus]GFK23625.1 hypothetical protein YA163_06880 [Tetragenococcus halophilus]
MGVYALTALLSLLIISPVKVLSYCNKKLNKPIENVLLLTSLFVPLLTASFRYNVGTDFKVYSSYQIPYVLNGFDKQFKLIEPLYQLVIKLGNFFGSYQWIFVFTHLIIILFIFFAIKKLSVDYFLSVLLFYVTGFYFLSLNGMRQFIAISVLIFSINYIYEKNFFKFFICSIIAVAFHKSAVVFLPIYFFNKVSFRNKKGIFFMIISLPIFIIFSNVLRQIIVYFASFIDRYTIYIGSQRDGIANNWLILLNVVILLISVTIYLCAFSKGEIVKKNQFETLVLIQYIATVTSLLTFIIPNGNRIVFNFMFSQILLIPILLKQNISKKTRIICFILVCCVYYLYCRFIFMYNAGEILPYSSWFS